MENNEIIKAVADKIEKACSPKKIILVSQKTNVAGELLSFKICAVVSDVPSVSELEASLYLEIDCDIPFDILIYNSSEWEKLRSDIGTYAWKIDNSGVVLNG